MISENVSSVDNQQERLDDENLGHFFVGFVEGEGSFNVSLRKKKDYKVGWQVVLSFNVSQKDPSLLFLLKETLHCGIIKVRKIDNVHSYDVTKPSDITNKIIPYFLRYPLFSISKKNNFTLFCKIANMMEKGNHLTQNGLHEILLIRELLNVGKGRKRKYSIDSVFSSQESPQTIRQTPANAGEDIVASA